jgi:TolA-binding protein
VTLTSGTLDVTVRPLAAGERFIVRTTDAEIEVRGMAFRVEAEQGRIRGIAVAEGAVEVRYAGFSAVIPSGGSWRATSSAAAPAVPRPIPPPAPSEARPPPSPPRAPFGVRAAPAPAREPREPRDAPSAAVSSPPPAPSAAPSAPPASREFAEAMRALGRGDYMGGAAQLEAFSVAHPGDPRADEADYLQAIALQRAGRAAEARAAARRYLATRSEGAHRAEARKIAGD